MTGDNDQQEGQGGRVARPDMVWLFFRFDGRIGRELFWLGIVFVWCLFLATIMMLGGGDLEMATSAGVFWFALVLSQWAELALLVKRLHDRGFPGWWAAAKFLPFVGLMMIVLVGLMAGDRGPNSYAAGPDQRGAPPASPGRGD